MAKDKVEVKEQVNEKSKIKKSSYSKKKKK